MTTPEREKAVARYPFAADAEQEPTSVQKNFIRYVKKNTGYDMDPTTVVLAQKWRTKFRESDENQADLAKRRAEAAAKLAERAAMPRRPVGRPRKNPLPETVAAEAPKRRGRPPKNRPEQPVVETAPKRRGRPPKVRVAVSAENIVAMPKRRGRPPKNR